MATRDYSIENTIAINISPSSPYLEGKSIGQVISPGMLLALDPDVEDDPFGVVKHYAPNVPTCKMFATENIYSGKTIYEDYAASTKVMARVCRTGDIVYAWYTSIAGPTSYIAMFQPLTSNGDGTLQFWSDTDAKVGGLVGFSMERHLQDTHPDVMRLAIMVA